MEIKSGTYIATASGIEPAPFTKGFYVSLAGLETVISRNALSAELFEQVTSAYASLALQNDGLVGVWESDGDVYFDVSQHVEDRNDALQLGKDRNQKAIWDIGNGEEIRTDSGAFISTFTHNGIIHQGISTHSAKVASDLARGSALKALNGFWKD
jgi:hypothetical protein